LQISPLLFVEGPSMRQITFSKSIRIQQKNIEKGDRKILDPWHLLLSHDAPFGCTISSAIRKQYLKKPTNVK